MIYSDHSAEEAILGAVMLDPKALDLVDLPPDAFGDPRCRAAWTAMSSLGNAGGFLDPISISDEAGSDLGVYLSELLLRTITASNVEHYAEIVRRKWLTRQVVELADRLINHAAQGTEGSELLGEAIAGFCGMDLESDGKALSIGQLVKDRYKELGELIDAKVEGKPIVTGYTTGVADLDELLGGYQPGIVTIVCARPGMGKSSLAMVTAEANSAAGKGVHVFSLEDTRSAYTDRAISAESGIPAENLRTASINQGQFGQLRDASQSLVKRKHWIVDDRCGLSASDVVRAARREMRDNETGIVIVDYLTLLSQSSGRGRARHEEVAADVNTLADAARNDNMAYIVLAQLSRSLESRTDKVPVPADLREAGEERAKTIIALYRPVMYDPNADASIIQLYVIKNNQGRTGFVEAKWSGPTMRIA